VLALQAVGGWSSQWAPLAAAMAAWRLGTRGNVRGGELDSFYRRSCLGEGVTVWRKGGARCNDQWQLRGGAVRVRRRARERKRSTAVRPLVGRRRGQFARPEKVRRVATRVWVWKSVRSRGTGGRSGAPAVVLGRPVAQAGVTTRTTSCVGANARHRCLEEFDLTLFNCVLLQNFQQKWSKW
jgi:hypothetical protein